MLSIINVICYIATALLILSLIYTFVILPLKTKADNDKTIQSQGDIRFFKFNYQGPVFFQATSYDSAARQFRGMKRDQQKILKSYEKRPGKPKVKPINGMRK